MNQSAVSKVPEVTLLFWVLKVAATTLGETGGDAVSMSMNLGYLVGTAIFASKAVSSASSSAAMRRRITLAATPAIARSV